MSLRGPSSEGKCNWGRESGEKKRDEKLWSGLLYERKRIYFQFKKRKRAEHFGWS